MYSYDHPTDPIGPEPTHNSPDQRAAWHEAFRAHGPADGSDVRGMPDGRLWLIRDIHTAETQWAPRHVGGELRLVCLGAANADLNSIREDAEIQAARKDGDHQRARRYGVLAAGYWAMSERYRQQEPQGQSAMMARRAWSLEADPARCRNRHDQLLGHARTTYQLISACRRHRLPQHAPGRDFADPLVADRCLAVDTGVGALE